MLCTLCAITAPLSTFAACSDSDKSSSVNADDSSKISADDDGKISIVATNFPQYDWVKNIVGDSIDMDLTFLGDNGTDLHNFEPTADDIITISECDIFIYIGGESDRWVEDALSQAVNKDMIKINLLECLGDKAQYIDNAHDDCDDDCTHIYDEHVWLSLKNAETLCTAITESIISLCPDKKETLSEYLNDYIGQLQWLDEQYTQFFATLSKPLIFADRFPFLYMYKDYSFEYYAAFSGCSTESEASFDTITFLADKIDSYDIGAIFALKDSDSDIAKAVIAASSSQDVIVYKLNSMQSVSKYDIQYGADYLKNMENNLYVLEAVLN